MRLYKKIIGFYFFLGAIASAAFYFLTQSGNHLLAFLIPNIITAIVLLAYAFISGKYILQSEKYETAFQIMLIIQLIQFDLKGYIFKNFYFPELSINLDLRDSGYELFTYSSFSVKIFNGYLHFDPAMIFSINIFLLLFLVIHSIMIKKATKQSFYGS